MTNLFAMTWKAAGQLTDVAQNYVDTYFTSWKGAAMPGLSSKMDIELGGHLRSQSPITYLAASINALLETAGGGSVAATLSIVGDDYVAPASFLITSDPSGFFEIVGDELRVKAGAVFDYESISNYPVAIEGTDAAPNTYSRTVNVQITNVNEAPTTIFLSANNVDENALAGSVVGIASVSDPDAGDTFSFAVTVDPSGFFEMVGDQLRVKPGATFDFETATSHNITIQVTDGGALTFSDNFTINVNDVNEVPTDISLSSTDAVDGSSIGTVIAIISSADVDAGDSSTYTKITDPDNRFLVVGNELRVNGAMVETATHDVTIRVTDSGGLFYDELFTISVISAASINITAIDADGWKATYPSPPAEFDPVGALETVPVLRNGFDASGSATTLTDNVALMKRVRLPYPNQATLTADDVALSEFVYSGDTIATVTNNSTLAYPKPQAVWLNHDLDVCRSATYTARLTVAHCHARNGRPVAAVKFTATDGTTTIEQTVSSMDFISYSASGLGAPHFKADLDFSSLNAGVMITIDAVIYPWVGDAFTVSTANTYPNANLTSFKVLNDHNGSYGSSYAYVNTATGNDGTGIFSATPATAQATPYATIAAAALDAAAFNNSEFGRNSASGSIIRLEVGTHIHSSYSGTTVTDVPLIVEAANPANKATTIYQDGAASTNGSCPKYFKFKGITLQRTGGNKIVWANNASLSTPDYMAVMENCTFDLNGSTVYDPAIYHVGRFWLINCDGDNIGQSQTFGTQAKTTISIGSAEGSVREAVYSAIACKDLDGFFGQTVASSAKIASKGQFLGWCHIGQNTNSSVNLNIISLPIGDEGLAVVGCVLEQHGGTTGPCLAIGADGQIESMQNVNMFNLTVVGSRTNYLYQDTGSVTIDKSVGAHKFCVHKLMNTKGDVFGTDANLIGNWPVLYRVGHSYNTSIEGSSSDDVPGIGSWLGEVAAIGSVFGTDIANLNPDWTNDQSADGGSGGNGDYTPGVSTEIVTIPAGLTAYSHDMAGVAIATNGTAHGGAL